MGSPAKKRKARPPAKSPTYWSAYVTRHSNALDLEQGVFTGGSPRKIAISLKRSAEASRRRKGSAYQSALSMLNFYVNRAGSNLSVARKNRLDRAKAELRKLFGRSGMRRAPRPARRARETGHTRRRASSASRHP